METKRVAATAGSEFRLAVVDHGTFGSHPIAEGGFILDDSGEMNATIGEGTVRIRTAFETLPPVDDTASISGSVANSPANRSALRKSFMGRKDRGAPPS